MSSQNTQSVSETRVIFASSAIVAIVRKDKIGNLYYFHIRLLESIQLISSIVSNRRQRFNSYYADEFNEHLINDLLWWQNFVSFLNIACVFCMIFIFILSATLALRQCSRPL
jgi:hypothetical protein